MPVPLTSQTLRTVAVVLTPLLVSRVDRLASEERCSRSAILREIVELGLRVREAGLQTAGAEAVA